MTSESSLWQKFNKLSAPLVHHIERIDAKNIPDIHILNKKKQTIWVELKYVRTRDFPKKTDTKTCLQLKKEQGIWHFKYNRALGTSYVLVFIEPLDEYWLFPGNKATILASKKWSINSLRAISKQYKTLNDVIKEIL